MTHLGRQADNARTRRHPAVPNPSSISQSGPAVSNNVAAPNVGPRLTTANGKFALGNWFKIAAVKPIDPRLWINQSVRILFAWEFRSPRIAPVEAFARRGCFGDSMYWAGLGRFDVPGGSRLHLLKLTHPRINSARGVRAKSTPIRGFSSSRATFRR